MKKDEEKQTVIPQTGDPQEGECVSTRPKRNPDVNLRGRLKGWSAEGVYEFAQSVQHPEMKREVMHKTKHVTVAKTAGEKESSIILTAKVDSDLPDPIGSAIGMMVSELKDRIKQEPNAKYPTSSLLLETERMTMWQNKSKKKLNIHITLDLKNPQIMQMELQELQTMIYKTINRNFLYR